MLALGKIAASPEEFCWIRQALRDPNLEVRHSALVALGISGSEDAERSLLHIAQHGTFSPEEAWTISPWARSLAVLALGLGRERGLSPKIDPFVAVSARGLEGVERERLGTALLLYHSLAPSRALEPFALSFLPHGDPDIPLRCRAVEALGSSGLTDHTTRLIFALSDPQLEVRRSAALALGVLADPSSQWALTVAAEKNRDALVRGFALISLGRIGGGGAKDALLKALRWGGNALRPWAVLGLGILARAAGDPEARTVIREAYRREGNQDSKRACLLASGIARDRDALPLLAQALFEGTEIRLRSAAALALGMVRAEDARHMLLAAAESEKSGEVRAAVAAGLGAVGNTQDTEILLRLFRGVNHPESQALAGLALGLHGAEATFEALKSELPKPLRSSARASLLRSVGLLLGDDGEPVLARLAGRANFSTFPGWLREVLRRSI